MLAVWLIVSVLACRLGHTVQYPHKTTGDTLGDLDELAAILRTWKCNKEAADLASDEVVVRENLQEFNELFRKNQARQAAAEWNYETDVTPEKSKKVVDVQVKNAKTNRMMAQYAQGVKEATNFDCYSDDTRRQIELFSVSATSSDPNVTRRVSQLNNKMTGIYSKEKFCKNEKCYTIEPDLEDIASKSRNPDELLEAWLGARDAVGRKVGKLYPEFVEMINTGAKENGFADFGDYWRVEQFGNTDGLVDMLEGLWDEIKPIYEQLHAYVHRKLIDRYGSLVAGQEGHGIPAHLLGNLWAQLWGDIYDIVAPFPEVEEVNITLALEENNFDVDRIFREAESFFKSIGLYAMTDKFWKNSALTKPTDGRDFVCHGSASDLYTRGDFRIKMCTKVDAENFEVVHHEMGHIEYFMAYEGQPTAYRTGANSGFHEAVGDTISLSVSSQKHLRRIGLVRGKTTDDRTTSKKREINTLMKMALNKIGFLPFGYLIDKWRWDIFSGEIKPNDYNRKWWEMRLKYQGVVAPIPRSADDFDPGSKFHIPDNDYYIAYFVSFLLQFQFYESMCDISGHTGPLHECDFYKSKEAGGRLKELLSLGASKPWPEALKIMTGKDKIDTGSIRRYFKPLIDWLEQVNRDQVVGWKHATVNWKES